MTTRWELVEPPPRQWLPERPKIAPDHWPADETAELAADVAARNAVLRYWSEVGWHVRASGDQVLLRTEQNLLGLSIPLPLAWHLLEQLRAQDARGPVVGIPGGERRRWIFLIGGLAPPAYTLPRSDLLVVRAGTDIPLPPSPLPHGIVEWISRPDSNCSLFDHASVSLAVDLLLRRCA